ncbi:MAG: pitrilysin family protein [Geitlerinemataceae cyanobacterium]
MTYRTVLDNGMAIVAVENTTADIMAARIFIGAGSCRETRHNAGLAHLIAAVMTKGTADLSSMEIAEKVESVGAGLGTEATPDYFLLSLKTVAADFDAMLHLAGDLLRYPAFPESEVELERRLTLQAIRSQKEQPMGIAFDRLRGNLYGDHPYAISSLGVEDSVAGLTRADLQQYHQTYFRPDNIVVSLTGCANPQTAIAAVEKVFGDWKAPPTPLPPYQFPEIVVQPRHSIVPQDTQQSIVMLGYLAPSITESIVNSGNYSDYASLKLLGTYLGNGLSSRLFVELREKRGLAYDVSAFFPTRLAKSHFVTYMGTAPQNTQIALDGLRSEVDRLRDVRLSEEELQTAKNKLLGQYALGKQTNAQIAQLYGWYEILGLGIEFDRGFVEAISAVTSETVQASVKQYLTEPYISLVGPDSAVNQKLTSQSLT